MRSKAERAETRIVDGWKPFVYLMEGKRVCFQAKDGGGREKVMLAYMAARAFLGVAAQSF